MNEKKFDARKLEKLNNPQRLIDIPPEVVWEKLDLESPGVIVDLGAGTAFFSVAFQKQSSASTVYACDMSQVMIDWVRENVSPDHPDVVPVKTEEDAVPLDDGIADLVFMINVHHELESPSRTLQESNRLLKPDGSLFVVDWKKADMPEGPPAKRRVLPEQVGKQMAIAGFEEVAFYDEMPKHFLVVGKKKGR